MWPPLLEHYKSLPLELRLNPSLFVFGVVCEMTEDEEVETDSG